MSKMNYNNHTETTIKFYKAYKLHARVMVCVMNVACCVDLFKVINCWVL